MSPAPELSRNVPLRRLGSAGPDEAGLVMVVDADAAECARLARRLDVPEVLALSCRFRLSPADRHGIVLADGLLQARVVRLCVATLEAFETSVTECFSVRFVPAERLAGGIDAELDLEADDDVPYEGTSIDLGEAAVEQLALALDPYPHKPGVERPAGVTIGDPPTSGTPGDGRPAGAAGLDGVAGDPDSDNADERPMPFAALARLRDRN